MLGKNGGKAGGAGGPKAATMTLNEPVYGVRVAKVKQEIKARISTLKRRRRRRAEDGGRRMEEASS